MIPLPPPNTRAHPYRGLSVQEVDIPLDPASILSYLDGREVYRRTEYLALRDRRGADRAGRGAQGEPGAAVLAGRRGPGAGRAGRDGLGRLAGDRRRQRHRAGRRAAEPGARASVVHRAVRARQLHLGAGADPGPGHRGRAAGAAEAARPGPAGRGLRRGPAARRAGARRGAGRGPRRGAPGARRYLLPCRGSGTELGAPVAFLDTRPARAAAGLAADRLRAVAAVPPPLLRRRAGPGRLCARGPGVDRGRGRRRRSPSAACSNAGSRWTATPPWCRGGPTSTRSARALRKLLL